MPPHKVILKLEGFSITGSIKLKTALFLLDSLEQMGGLKKGDHIIESSSGNLGLALSMLCAARGYRFTCVSDPNMSPNTADLIKSYGAELLVVTSLDGNGGYLETRLALIRAMMVQNPLLRWPNQYENYANVRAHYCLTGPEIVAEVGCPDYVFVGVGTTGTLGGVARYLRERSPNTTIVAVDSIGSVTFGFESGRRRIPGIGTSTPPKLREHAEFDELMMVDEKDTIQTCRLLASRGILLGGSTGTVLHAVKQYSGRFRPQACIVAISPDLGDRYADTIYNDTWVAKNFPEVSLSQRSI